MKEQKDEILKDRPYVRDIVRSLLGDAPAFLFGRRPMNAGIWEPMSDIYERDEEYVISVDLPGISMDDLKLIMENNTLSISGSRPIPQEYTDECCYRRERMFGGFEKHYNIPDNINRDGVKARFDDGVLTVTLPKLAETRKKNIKINISKK